MKSFSFVKYALLGCVLSASLFSCKDETNITDDEDKMAAQALATIANDVPVFYALTDNNELVKYMTKSSLSDAGVMPIMGLMAAEKIVAIDFRPATGQLYGVSNQNRLYIIDLNTAMATMLGTSPFTTDMLGSQIGFDFNPTVDRIRLVSSTGMNLRLHPETGALVATDGAISMSSAMITAAAYNNNMAGASTTTLFDIDAASDKLYKQDPPNNGTLVEVGMLGVKVESEGGFDVAANKNIAIAALFESGQTKYKFYTIDLTTGKATNVGKTDRKVIGLAIPTMMVAYGIDNNNTLLIMHPEANSTVTKAITGLDAGVNIVGIDMRPVTGQLYALGSNSRLYTLNMANGAAVAIGSDPFMPILEGTSFGFDFNPTVDRIRIVSNSGQNLRVHPVTGMVAFTDAMITPSTAMVEAVAYTNNFPGSTMTTLYDIDVASDMLYMQLPPNDGILSGGKPLGIDIAAANGFDIGGMSNKAWAVLKVGTTTSLYSIDLSTGKATSIMPLTTSVNGFAVGIGF